MISGVVSTSILIDKATKYSIRNISRASPDIQLAIFRETMADLENYLDTNDTRKLTTRSLGIIRDDVLQTIAGIRDLRPRLIQGTVNSTDATLEKLRIARDNLQVAIGMFDSSGLLKESQSKKFFTELRLARKNIEDALGWFRPTKY